MTTNSQKARTTMSSNGNAMERSHSTSSERKEKVKLQRRSSYQSPHSPVVGIRRSSYQSPHSPVVGASRLTPPHNLLPSHFDVSKYSTSPMERDAVTSEGFVSRTGTNYFYKKPLIRNLFDTFRIKVSLL